MDKVTYYIHILWPIKYSQLNNISQDKGSLWHQTLIYFLDSQKNHRVQYEGDQKYLKMLAVAAVRQKADPLGACL